MPKASFGDMLRFLFRKDLAHEAGDRTDGEFLLKQFAATREDAPLRFSSKAAMVQWSMSCL